MKRWSFVVGGFLVIIGVFSLLQALLDAVGISFRIWWVFWPLVLIGVGAWFIMGVSRGSSADAPREQADIPLEGATEATLVIHHGAGHLAIAAGTAGSDTLLSGTFCGGLDASRRREGDRLLVDMKVKDRDVSHYIFPWARNWAGMLDWSFTLTPSIPLSLVLETGASDTHMALGELAVRELRVKTGASSTTIECPAHAGLTRVAVESGAASIRIRVPAGVAATVGVKSALAGISVDPTRFPPCAGGYRSPDYDSAVNKVDIEIETGVGSVDIR